MHSKGAYLLPLKIRHKYQVSHQTTADYLAAVICHNTESNSSYLQVIGETLAKTVRKILLNFVDLKRFVAFNNNIS